MYKTTNNYELIVAESYLCIPATLKTILKSEGFISTISQYEIADYFGINVPLDYKTKDLININRTSNSNEWGIKLNKESINSFFKFYNIPLHERYIPINTLLDWEFSDTIINAINEKKHIVCGYSNNLLFNDKEGKIGHVSLITGISDNEIEILNPGPDNSGFQRVDLYQLYNSIRLKKDGLWLIERK